MRSLKGLLGPALLAITGGVLAFVIQAAAQTPRPGAIETAPLTQLDGWSVGARTRAQGAFAPTLWRSSNPQVLATLFDRVPASFASPSARALAEAALVSPGQAPEGEGVELAMRKRFEALGRMGSADALAQMAAGAGSAASDPGIAMYAAQAELARGQRPQACGRGRAASGDTPSPFLLKLRAYCAAAQGERAAADLALELVRGANAEDAWFRSAVSGVGEGARRPSVTARFDNSLNASVSLAANLRPGANALNNASTLALLVAARTETTPQPLRAQATSAALARGALTAAQAREILRATPATVTAGAPYLLAAARALEAQPQDAAAIAVALRAARTPGEFAAASYFFRADLAALTATPDAAAAMLFARAALTTGEAELAARFIAAAEASNAAPAGLGPLQAALAIQRQQVDEIVLRRRTDAAAGSTAAAAAAARDLAIISALGYPLDPGARGFMLAIPAGGGNRIDPGLLALIASASEHNALGETALATAIAVAPGPGTLEIGSLTEVLRALRAADLSNAARRIAVEAVLAGPPR